MRTILAVVLTSCICHIARAEPPPPPEGGTANHYLLIDASGSMKDAIGDVQRKLEAVVELLDETDQMSISFFGQKPSKIDHSVGCNDELPVADLIPVDSQIPDFPELGGPNDRTSIGKALEAALSTGGDGANVVLITDGIEECNSDFVEIRQRFPNATIRVLQVGNSQNTALQLLELAPKPSIPLVTVPVPLPVSVLGPTPTPEANWLTKVAWILVLALSALAAALFCLQSGERTKSLQDQLAGLDKKASQDLAALYTGTKKLRGKVVPKKDRERFSLYWFRNRNFKVIGSYGFWSMIVLVFAICGWLGLVFQEIASLVLTDEFAQAVRVDSWRFLNSNIGAYSFAGTILALFGFSAFQWWQTLEAKKELMIRAGIIATERSDVARKQYERVRQAIRKMQFNLPKRSAMWYLPEEFVEIPGFDALASRLLDLAAPRFEEATPNQLRDIEVFTNIRDPLAFSQLLLQENALTADQYRLMEQILDHARRGQFEEAQQTTATLFEVLSRPEETPVS